MRTIKKITGFFFIVIALFLCCSHAFALQDEGRSKAAKREKKGGKWIGLTLQLSALTSTSSSEICGLTSLGVR